MRRCAPARCAARAGNLVIEVAGELDTVRRVESVPVTGSDGRVAHVGDVASVTRTVRTPGDELAFSDGRPAVLIAATLEEGLQVDVWMDDVREVTARFATRLPAGNRSTSGCSTRAPTRSSGSPRSARTWRSASRSSSRCCS